jgi:hypothetical protein
MKHALKTLALAAALTSVATAATAQETVRWGIPMAFGSNLTALGDTMPWVSEQLKKSRAARQPAGVRARQAGAPAGHLRQRVLRQGRGRLQLHGL